MMNRERPCENVLNQYRDHSLSQYFEKHTQQYKSCSMLIQQYWLCVQYDSNEN